jgi:hypothetical protein
MNTEPPTGDELQRMLVAMKQSVIERAEPPARPVRRRRHVGIAIGLVALLVVGTASGAYALGLVPHDLFAGPVAAPSPSATVVDTPSPVASAPVTSTPVSTPTPSATPAKVFALDDPRTWTISFTEVGPIALGAPYDAEIDDLRSAYKSGNGDCPNPNVSFWYRDGSATLVVEEQDGVVSGVAVGLVSPSDPALLHTTPTLAKGIGDGSTLDEVKAAYPEVQRTGTFGSDDGTGVFDLWSLQQDGHAITFMLGDDGMHVGQVWVGSDPTPPYEFCG